MNEKLYLPPPLRKDAFQIAHQLHTGIDSTVNRLKLSVWWPKMRKDVVSWIQQCSLCSEIRPKRKNNMSSWEKNNVFERIHADWCFIPNIGNVLLIVDSTSGWIEASAPMDRTSVNVINSLTSLRSRFGVPKIFVTDNAPEFTSLQFNEW